MFTYSICGFCTILHFKDTYKLCIRIIRIIIELNDMHIEHLMIDTYVKLIAIIIIVDPSTCGAIPHTSHVL